MTVDSLTLCGSVWSHSVWGEQMVESVCDLGVSTSHPGAATKISPTLYTDRLLRVKSDNVCKIHKISALTGDGFKLHVPEFWGKHTLEQVPCQRTLRESVSCATKPTYVVFIKRSVNHVTFSRHAMSNRDLMLTVAAPSCIITFWDMLFKMAQCHKTAENDYVFSNTLHFCHLITVHYSSSTKCSI